MAYDDLFPRDTRGYDAAHDEMDAAFRRDVLRRARAADVDPEQFDDMIECDLYLQSIGA